MIGFRITRCVCICFCLIAGFVDSADENYRIISVQQDESSPLFYRITARSKGRVYEIVSVLRVEERDKGRILKKGKRYPLILRELDYSQENYPTKEFRQHSVNSIVISKRQTVYYAVNLNGPYLAEEQDYLNPQNIKCLNIREDPVHFPHTKASKMIVFYPSPFTKMFGSDSNIPPFETTNKRISGLFKIDSITGDNLSEDYTFCVILAKDEQRSYTILSVGEKETVLDDNNLLELDKWVHLELVRLLPGVHDSRFFEGNGGNHTPYSWMCHCLDSSGEFYLALNLSSFKKADNSDYGLIDKVQLMPSPFSKSYNSEPEWFVFSYRPYHNSSK